LDLIYIYHHCWELEKPQVKEGVKLISGGFQRIRFQPLGPLGKGGERKR
jgi:hypothetical protein